MTHSIHLLAGAFALDALDPADRAAFVEHLADCKECRDETTGLRATAALLAEIRPETPSPELRQQILTRISHVRPLPPIVPPAHATTSSLAAHRQARGRRLGGWVSVAAAAAVVAVLAAGTAPWSPRGSPTPVSAGYEVMHAPDRRHSTVESDTGWAATVWHSDSMHQAVIVTTNMPKTPPGMVYQVWFDQPSSGSVSAGLMPAGPDQSLALQGDAASANGTSVTLEPEGGSATPTSDPVAVFDFGQGA